eukprot:6074063-Pyramimonas_sp.AAC.1
MHLRARTGRACHAWNSSTPKTAARKGPGTGAPTAHRSAPGRAHPPPQAAPQVGALDKELLFIRKHGGPLREIFTCT